jgi:hypothetical protein
MAVGLLRPDGGTVKIFGLAWGALLCWRSVQLAQQRLESHGPEIFARVRTPAS